MKRSYIQVIGEKISVLGWVLSRTPTDRNTLDSGRRTSGMELEASSGRVLGKLDFLQRF